MKIIDKTDSKEHVYPTYGRNFLSYRWYKPILVGMFFGIFYIVLSIALVIGLGVGGVTDITQYIASGYDDFNITDWQGSLLNLGVVAIMIPALWLARMVVRDRPFSSYTSARGGWDGRAFFVCLLIAIVVIGVPTAIQLYMERDTLTLVNKFTWISFAVLTVIGPLQCIAEEYIFRGLLMQTLGSWFRLPIIAVILQAAIFACAHPYNNIGKAEIFISGLTFGLVAWLGRGIEASSALHIANNMIAFYLVGLSLTTISSEATMQSLQISAAADAVYVLIILILSKTTNLFNRARKSDVNKWNNKIENKQEKKAAKQAAKMAKKEGSYGKHDVQK